MSIYDKPRSILPIFNPYDFFYYQTLPITLSEADARYMLKSGGSFSGKLNLSVGGRLVNNNGVQPPVVMTSPNTPSGYIASESSFQAANRRAWRLFNYTLYDATNDFTANGAYNGTTGLYAGAVSTTITTPPSTYLGEWAQIEFPTAFILRKFTIYPRISFAFRAPVDFVVLGSNDGTTWIRLFITTGTVWTDYPQNFTISSPTTSYRFYRMAVNQIGIDPSATLLNFSKWILYSNTNENALWFSSQNSVGYYLWPNGDFLWNQSIIWNTTNLSLFPMLIDSTKGLGLTSEPLTRYIGSNNPANQIELGNETTFTFGSSVASIYGGVLAPNGLIYGAPLNSTQVLVINPTTNTTNTINIGSGGWTGSVLAPNGLIYCIPFSATQILVINPSTNTASTFGSLSGSNKWVGGVLAPNGLIYGIPADATSVLVINPSTNTTSTFGSLSGSNKWGGGVLAPNGLIYGIPRNSTSVLVIDPTTNQVSTFGSLSGTLKWEGGVLAPNGLIYGIPRNSTSVLVIDPTTNQASTFGSFIGNDKWAGGVLAPNGLIYGIPFSSTSVLVIDPTTNQVSTFGSLSGSLKWVGGVLAPNGLIYGIPLSSTEVLVIATSQVIIDANGDVIFNVPTFVKTTNPTILEYNVTTANTGLSYNTTTNGIDLNANFAKGRLDPTLNHSLLPFSLSGNNLVNCPEIGNSAGNFEFRMNSTGAGGSLTLTGGTGLLAATAGGSSGQHLVLTINGVNYKIKLENV